jgi:hypothetical protein
VQVFRRTLLRGAKKRRCSHLPQCGTRGPLDRSAGRAPRHGLQELASCGVTRAERGGECTAGRRAKEKGPGPVGASSQQGRPRTVRGHPLGWTGGRPCEPTRRAVQRRASPQQARLTWRSIPPSLSRRRPHVARGCCIQGVCADCDSKNTRGCVALSQRNSLPLPSLSLRPDSS